jgi:hypothetical protein
VKSQQLSVGLTKHEVVNGEASEVDILCGHCKWKHWYIFVFRSCCMVHCYGTLTHCFACFFLQTDEELDPEDVEFDEHYTIETRSKCKAQIPSFFT